MLRTALALTLGAAVLAPITAFSGPAAAAADTCRGLPATIVGTPGEPITGTEGPDVIVSNNARSVAALGGDDTICLTDHDGTVNHGFGPGVDAGAGDDVVDGTTVPASLEPGIELGDGADTYLGGPAADRVFAGVEGDEIARWRVYADDDQDVVETGAGNDWVYTGSEGALTDQIDLGSGVGGLVLAADELGEDGSLALADEASLLFLRPTDDVHGWFVNLGKRGAAATRDAAADPGTGAPRVAWTGNPAVEVWGEQVASFTGSAGADRIFAQQLTWASTGGGNDSVSMLTWEGEGLARVVGGKGNDRLAIAPVTDPSEYNVRDRVVYDVAEGEATFEAVPDPATYAKLAFWGIERHYVEGFISAVLRGSPGVDQLVAGYLGGVATVYGGAGNDRIGYIGNGSTLLGSRSRLLGGPGNDTITNVEVPGVLEGGPGNDRIEGGSSPFGDKLYGNDGNDVLLGGPGPDEAWGGRGTDRCVAEQRTGCER